MSLLLISTKSFFEFWNDSVETEVSTGTLYRDMKLLFTNNGCFSHLKINMLLDLKISEP